MVANPISLKWNLECTSITGIDQYKDHIWTSHVLKHKKKQSKCKGKNMTMGLNE